MIVERFYRFAFVSPKSLEALAKAALTAHSSRIAAARIDAFSTPKAS